MRPRMFKLQISKHKVETIDQQAQGWPQSARIIGQPDGTHRLGLPRLLLDQRKQIQSQRVDIQHSRNHQKSHEHPKKES